MTDSATRSRAEKQERLRALLTARLNRPDGGEAPRGDDSHGSPIVPVPRTDAGLPLSLAQERLWLVDRLRPDSATYNVPAGLRLRGVLDEGALERALAEVVRRHESLRTTLAERDGERVQVIHPFTGFALPAEDLTGLPEADREAAVRARAAEVAGAPFDLAAGPLVRARLLRLAADDRVLLVCMHHVVTDGWSMGVLFTELTRLYGAFAEGKPSPLPELPLQYADYAAWQRTSAGAAAMARHRAYWKARMAGAPALLELPTDRPRTARRLDEAGTVPFDLPAPLTARLEALARAEGATLYMVLVAAFQLLLGRYAGSDDVCVGSPVAGRTRVEMEGLIGFFVNTVVLRTRLDGDPTFRVLLDRVRTATLEAYEHQALPFETLVADLQPERSAGWSPVFQAMIALLNADGGSGSLPGVTLKAVEMDTGTAMFDLSLNLVPRNGGLGGTLKYAADLWEHETI
ncbi:condensation domain-containing protein, partial [Longimicrobium sp.]|uniref:condensation domain-containing protein n=1 Tax=Longimicrobium sp. TaxID=2029185 RepID=UPI002E2F19AD